MILFEVIYNLAVPLQVFVFKGPRRNMKVFTGQ